MCLSSSLAPSFFIQTGSDWWMETWMGTTISCRRSTVTSNPWMIHSVWFTDASLTWMMATPHAHKHTMTCQRASPIGSISARHIQSRDTRLAVLCHINVVVEHEIILRDDIETAAVQAMLSIWACQSTYCSLILFSPEVIFFLISLIN